MTIEKITAVRGNFFYKSLRLFWNALRYGSGLHGGFIMAEK